MMNQIDDDKLGKYRSQVKQRKLCRLVFLVAFVLAAGAFTFVFSGPDSQLVTTASKYHPKVKDIHHKLSLMAHRHLNKAHVHLKDHHWKLSNAPPDVSWKLRGGASSFIHTHHINHRKGTSQDKQEQMATHIVEEEAPHEQEADEYVGVQEDATHPQDAAAEESKPQEEPIAME